MMGHPGNVAPRKMWFADTDEDAPNDHCPWQPVLQLDGFCASVSMWFATEAECEAFIRENLVGTGWMDGPTRYPCPECGVGPQEWCVNLSTGQKRHTFHSDRLRYRVGGWPS
jgi:hypothetical protein